MVEVLDPVQNASISAINFVISTEAFVVAFQFASNCISHSNFIQLERRNTVARRRIFFIKKSKKVLTLVYDFF